MLPATGKDMHHHHDHIYGYDSVQRDSDLDTAAGSPNAQIADRLCTIINQNINAERAAHIEEQRKTRLGRLNEIW